MSKLLGIPAALCVALGLAGASTASAQSVSYTGQFLPFDVQSINSQGQAIGYNVLVNGGATNNTAAFSGLPLDAPILFSNGIPYAISADLTGCGTQFTTDTAGSLYPVQLTENGRIMIWAYQNEACLLTPVPGSATSINTASGLGALQNNSSGASNTAAGYDALNTNSSGSNNTAFGANALFSNSSGKGNAAQGVNALYSNTTGIRNLGIGSNALYGNVSGSYNVALGFDAGYNQTNGNDNIYLNNLGVAGESQTLRLGTQGTAGVVGSGILSAFVAGVATSQVTGSAVYVTASGQLGVQGSSERFKTDIATMPDLSRRLQQLRPVTFRYKTDSSGTTQYGLIAEEVAQVYPELVIRDDSGHMVGVHYEELAPMLLGEVQRQRETMTQRVELLRAHAEEQAAEIRALKQQVAELNDLRREMNVALRTLRAEDGRMAKR